MAVGQREERQPARWLHVNRGDLLDKKSGETLGWASGVITGVRMAQSEKFGHLELHIRLHDAAIDETVIIAGTLATVDPGTKELRDFTIWSRMLVGRLISKKNRLTPEEPVRIEFYPIETDYGDAACVALYRENSDVRLEGVKISTEDRDTMAKGLFWLAERYAWGAGSTKLPVEREVKRLGGYETAEETAEVAETLPDDEPAIDAEEPKGLPGNEDMKRVFTRPTVSEEDRARVNAVAANMTEEDDDLPF